MEMIFNIKVYSSCFCSLFSKKNFDFFLKLQKDLHHSLYPAFPSTKETLYCSKMKHLVFFYLGYFLEINQLYFNLALFHFMKNIIFGILTLPLKSGQTTLEIRTMTTRDKTMREKLKAKKKGEFLRFIPHQVGLEDKSTKVVQLESLTILIRFPPSPGTFPQQLEFHILELSHTVSPKELTPLPHYYCSFLSSLSDLNSINLLRFKKNVVQLLAVDMQKLLQSFCRYSSLSPRVIQPSFVAQWSLVGSLAGKFCIGFYLFSLKLHIGKLVSTGPVPKITAILLPFIFPLRAPVQKFNNYVTGRWFINAWLASSMIPSSIIFPGWRRGGYKLTGVGFWVRKAVQECEFALLKECRNVEDLLITGYKRVILIKQSVEPNQNDMRLDEMPSPIRMLQCHIPPCDSNEVVTLIRKLGLERWVEEIISLRSNLEESKLYIPQRREWGYNVSHISFLARVRLSKQLLRMAYYFNECTSGTYTTHHQALYLRNPTSEGDLTQSTYIKNKGVVPESNLVFPLCHLKCFNIKLGMVNGIIVPHELKFNLHWWFSQAELLLCSLGRSQLVSIYTKALLSVLLLILYNHQKITPFLHIKVFPLSFFLKFFVIEIFCFFKFLPQFFFRSNKELTNHISNLICFFWMLLDPSELDYFAVVLEVRVQGLAPLILDFSYGMGLKLCLEPFPPISYFLFHNANLSCTTEYFMWKKMMKANLQLVNEIPTVFGRHYIVELKSEVSNLICACMQADQPTYFSLPSSPNSTFPPSISCLLVFEKCPACLPARVYFEIH
ncbi:hypothetical protein VP01_1784g3 [Puccinia sorghi]|uniref:Uncharacterized protein n=1 Tax=Puccinia sorghi TaxID=27349 RepID=A0A0L6VEP8_9BASI|nr:hypothetical protein VP01_1784g3 [Puccinia sorghi]